MHSPSMQRAQEERGAAAVEFALVLPVLVLLLFGIVFFAIGYNRKQGLQAAAREGARLAALPQSTQGDITGRVKDALDGVVDPDDVSVAISLPGTHPCDLQPSGTRVKVTVTAPFTYDIPLFGSETITMAGKGEFRCE